jgi:hypothetical protein
MSGVARAHGLGSVASLELKRKSVSASRKMAKAIMMPHSATAVVTMLQNANAKFGANAMAICCFSLKVLCSERYPMHAKKDKQLFERLEAKTSMTSALNLRSWVSRPS